MAGGVKRINDNFYLVVDEVGASSGIESETDSIDLSSSKGPKGNPAGKNENIHKTGSSNVSDAETQHFKCSSKKHDPVRKCRKRKENSAVNTDIGGTVNVLMTENSKSSDVDSENLEAVNMDIDNDSDESGERVDNELEPIIRILFRDEEIEKGYKSSFMKFLTQKIHHCTVLTNSKNSLELEIYENNSGNMLDFHLDTTPGYDSRSSKIPSYGKNNEILLSDSNSLQETTPTNELPSPICFNCNGKHFLRDCTLEKDTERIAYNKNKNQSAIKTPKNSRYHLDENQRFGNVVPGELSEELRTALDLTKEQQPLFIYRMRLLGYPPAWLEEARVSHSGVVVYDSNGQPITEDEEEGEIIPENAKDRFDISKIIEFPGFNVPLPKDMKEEGDIHECPPISEQQSKECLIKQLEPNAVQAYKKRSLTLPKCSPQEETNKDRKRLPSPTIEEMEEKKRLLLLELNNEDDSGEDKANQNQVGDSEIQDESEAAEDSTKVKDMDFGTPVLKSVSLYSKLPSREQFSVNVSEVINFENLPNSTGKYESMSSLIHRIRDTVSRIHNEANS